MNSFTDIYNKVSSGAFLYGYAVVALLLPNIALCYTECLAPWACGANVLLPLALYMWFFSLTRSEEHTSELQSRPHISYAVFCLKKKSVG